MKLPLVVSTLSLSLMQNKQIKKAIHINTNQLELLKFELIDYEHIVSFVDTNGFEIIRGFGDTIIEAINDLHKSLI